MDVIGIICEYNPFHNGHKYHIEEIKRKYPNSLVILVLNGYFLQRGEVSIITKENKAKIALCNNVDIVLELPFIYGSQSADTFANMALKILNNFHVNRLIFGSESNDIDKLKNLAMMQLEEGYNDKVKAYLSEGINYPTALAKALNQDFTFLPNDLLGISYIKAIISNNYKIEAETIKRTNSYHDICDDNNIVSATNIRNKIQNHLDVRKYLPEDSYKVLIKNNRDLYFKLLKYKINTDRCLKEYVDVDEGIEYRLIKYINVSNSLEEFINNIKTKRYTYNKLNRMFIHILVGLRKDDNKNIQYIKILGFNKNGQDYLSKLKEFGIPIVVDKNSKQYEYEIKTSIIYDLINGTNTYLFEHKNKPIII